MQVIRPSPGVKILRLLLCHVCHVPRDHGKVYHRTDTTTSTELHSSLCCAVLCGPVCPRLSVRPLLICPVYPSA